MYEGNEYTLILKSLFMYIDLGAYDDKTLSITQVTFLNDYQSYIYYMIYKTK